MLRGLELSLPTAVGLATYPPGATYGPRLLRDYEFVWIIEGNAEYRWGSTTVPAPAGSVLLCRPLPAPNETDFFRWDTQQRTRHGFFHFNITSVPAGWPLQNEWPLVRAPLEGDILAPMFRHLLSFKPTDPAPSPMQRMLWETTVAHLLLCYVTGQTSAADVPSAALPDAVEKAVRHIVRRLDADAAARIDLEELADVACVTREHLCRLFKSATGRTPVETVRRARIDRAAILLSRSNYSIAEIARLCGFSSPFHFSRCVKQAYGHSPTELRRSYVSGVAPLPLLARVQGV